MSRKLKKTGITNLWRNERGVYYLVAKIEGKRVVRSLKTSQKERAREVLADALKKEKGIADFKKEMLRGGGGVATEGSVKESLESWLFYQTRRPDLQRRTKDYYAEVVGYALSELSGDQLVSRLTREEMGEWWERIARRFSASTANNVLAAMKGALKFSEEAGSVVPKGVLARCRKMRIPPSSLVVPTNKEVEMVLLEVESGVKRSSQESRDLIEFLCFVGCRIGEAREVTWGDVDEETGEILIRGGEDEKGNSRTKGVDFRRVPIAARVKRLLERKRGFQKVKKSDQLFKIKSPKGALQGACRRLGLGHLRVHDLRHFFATHCIERGVDVPTVARWLGHKDGGALAMKRYGHVRNEHSQKMGKKIG